MGRICFDTNCSKYAGFNFMGQSYPIFCKDHKKEHMINIKNFITLKCSNNDCLKRASYNLINYNKPIYCKQHAQKDMIDVISARCRENMCLSIHPNFNLPNEKKGIYCSQHKKEGMIDVTHPMCTYKNCLTHAHFNFLSEKKPIYCSKHKEELMIDVSNKYPKCKSCNIVRGTKKYNNHCLRCCMYLFPEISIIKNYKTKEKTVTDFIIDNFSNFTWEIDKRVKNGCSYKRPDLLVDLGYQVIIIEIDEYKHNTYECSCENKRIMELYTDLGNRPVIFIRFNPDSYINKQTIKIKSCWKISNKNGILLIDNKESWNERLQVLKNHIEYWCNPDNITNKSIEVIQLYYDGFE
jgi:hypothetical protein